MTTRVLHLLNELRMSGAEVQLLRSFDAWHDRGVAPEILATAPDEGPLADELRDAGYPIHRLRYRPHPGYLMAFRRLVAGGDFDVVHIHSELANFWHGIAARSVPGTRVVRSIRNSFPFDGTLRVERVVQRRVLRWAGVRMVSVSPGVRRNELVRFRNRTTMIRNWIDTVRFRPPTSDERREARERYAIPDGLSVLVSVGNCGPAKNHEAILDAVADLPGWVYLHAGEESGDAERRRAHARGVADRVRFLGPVTDVVTLLHAADVFAMPSHYEGLGNAAVEALATGLPCVLAVAPGLDDLRDIGPAGIRWVDPSEPLHTAVSEARALTVPGRELHDAVAARYGMERGVDAYLELYGR